MGLILPYMAFALYFVLQLPEHAQPTWFPYVVLCYLVGSTFLFSFLRKRVLANAPPVTIEEQTVQSLSGARAARRMGYIWFLGPFLYLVSGGPSREPLWITLFGLSWAGFLSWVSFRIAKNTETKARQNTIPSS